MIFPSDLKPQSTDSIYFPDKTKDTNNSYKNEGGKKGKIFIYLDLFVLLCDYVQMLLLEISLNFIFVL